MKVIMKQLYNKLFFLIIALTSSLQSMEPSESGKLTGSDFLFNSYKHNPMLVESMLYNALITQNAPEFEKTVLTDFRKDSSAMRHSINSTDLNGLTLFHHACKLGDLAKVKILFDYGANLTMPIEIYDDNKLDECLSALHMATLCGHIQIIEFLLNKGADINAPDKSGMTSLHHALACNQLDVAELLIRRGARCLSHDKFGNTIFDYAVETGSRKLIDKVIRLVDDQGFTFLHQATITKNYILAKRLLINGANVNTQDKKNKTALHYACQSNDLCLITLLNDCKADWDLTDSEFNKPLHYLLSNNQSLTIIKTLLVITPWIFKNIQVRSLLELYISKNFEIINLSLKSSSAVNCIFVLAMQPRNQYVEDLIKYAGSINPNLMTKPDEGWTAAESILDTKRHDLFFELVTEVIRDQKIIDACYDILFNHSNFNFDCEENKQELIKHCLYWLPKLIEKTDSLVANKRNELIITLRELAHEFKSVRILLENLLTKVSVNEPGNHNKINFIISSLTFGHSVKK